MRVKAFLILAIALILGNSSFAQEHEKQEKFNAGDFVIEEVLDAYWWHIATYKGHELAIPLPVIVKSKVRNQWFFFWSNKLYHGKQYKGFFINHHSPNKGKIVELDSQGNLVRPLDLSITKNVVAIWISMIILFGVFIPIGKRYKQGALQPPKGLQALVEPIILFIRDDVARASIGDEKYEKYMPFLLSVFFFIFINNLLGLLPFFPGGANVTGNLAVTGVMAFFTFMITTISGTKHYWKHIFWSPEVPWWLKAPLPLMPFIELTGIFIKPTVLMIRLFANILGGHIVRITFVALIFIFAMFGIVAALGISVVSVLFIVFLTFLELLVAFIQAYVFTFLSAIYFGMAVEQGHH